MAKLLLLQGTGSGNEYPLEAVQVVIGRQPDVELRLNTPDVSRRHARIIREKEHFFLEDLGSSNGTFLNNLRLKTRTELFDRDQIRVGDYLLVFERQAP